MLANIFLDLMDSTSTYNYINHRCSSQRQNIAFSSNIRSRTIIIDAEGRQLALSLLSGAAKVETIRTTGLSTGTKGFVLRFREERYPFVQKMTVPPQQEHMHRTCVDLHTFVCKCVRVFIIRRQRERNKSVSVIRFTRLSKKLNDPRGEF